MDQFNINKLEADIERLSHDVNLKKNSPESKGMTEREIIKQALYPKVQNYTQTQATSRQTNNGDIEKIEEEIFPDYLKKSSEEIRLKIEELVDLTFRKGIDEAAIQAGKFGPFIVDAYHDVITDKLYEELKVRKLI